MIVNIAGENSLTSQVGLHATCFQSVWTADVESSPDSEQKAFQHCFVERLPLAWVDAMLTWWTRLQQLAEQQTLADKQECYHAVWNWKLLVWRGFGCTLFYFKHKTETHARGDLFFSWPTNPQVWRKQSRARDYIINRSPVPFATWQKVWS